MKQVDEAVEPQADGIPPEALRMGETQPAGDDLGPHQDDGDGDEQRDLVKPILGDEPPLGRRGKGKAAHAGHGEDQEGRRPVVDV